MKKRLGKRERATVARIAGLLKRLEEAADAQEARGNKASELTLLRWEFVMERRHGRRLTEMGVRKFADEDGRWQTS